MALEGESGSNELGNAYSVAALGLPVAAKITFRMESVYMTASSTYAQARTYSIQAATDLYGAGSAQVTSVTNAWNAVGVTTGAALVAQTTSPTTAATSRNNTLTVGESHALSLYPVPATNELHLLLDGNSEIVSVLVSDLRGATVSTVRYNGNGTLDVSNLAKGMYLINVSDGSQTFRQRFVKE